MLGLVKFFTDNRHCLRCILALGLLINGTVATAQQEVQTGQDSLMETVLPQTNPSLIKPPALPDRGLPPQISRELKLPENAYGPAPKESLSWMAGFNRLLQERINATNSGRLLPNSPSVRAFNGAFSDCLLALVNACSMNDFPIDTLNSNAGELIVKVPGQNKKRLFFLVGEMPAGKTTVSVTTDGGSLGPTVNQVQKIFDTTAAILEKRGNI